MNTSLPKVDRRTWRGAALAVLVVVFLMWFSSTLRELPTLVNQAVNIKGAMVLSVFGGAEPEPINPTGFPPEYRARLEAYSERRAEFHSRLPEPAPDTPAHDAWSRRIRVERAIVALIDAPGIEAQAAAFSSRAVSESPWDASSQGPLAEAREAEAYLDDNPSTPLRAYVWLFLMHRYKCALPPLRTEQAGEPEIGSVTMGYARARALAAGSLDPLVRLTAADIDVVASVYPLVRTSTR
jgi:hypothetical protein